MASTQDKALEFLQSIPKASDYDVYKGLRTSGHDCTFRTVKMALTTLEAINKAKSKWDANGYQYWEAV